MGPKLGRPAGVPRMPSFWGANTDGLVALPGLVSPARAARFCILTAGSGLPEYTGRQPPDRVGHWRAWGPK